MNMPLLCVGCTALAVSCATPGLDDRPADPPPDVGDGGTVSSDGATADDAAGYSVTDPPRCSAAGWCLMPLPDDQLTFKDVWPVGKRAFAIGNSTTGPRVLEWTGDQWTFIDHHAHHDDARTAMTNVWAPNEDEVFFAMHSLVAIDGDAQFGAFVYHGTRDAPPSTSWSWSRYDFRCDKLDGTVSVWGTSREDVYVLSCRKIYHLNDDSGDAGADGGVSRWAVDYADEDLANPVDLFGATGTAHDDAWFIGARGESPGSCAVVIHKSAAGYRRITDGIPKPGGNCDERPGFLTVSGSIRTAFHAPGRDRFVGVRFAPSWAVDNDVAKIAANGDGSYSVAFSSPSATMDVNLSSVWGASEDDLWFVATRKGAGGGVLRGTKLWTDGGAYQYSTLALNGAPNTESLACIRGTSNDNLWAVGKGRAYHKTTP